MLHVTDIATPVKNKSRKKTITTTIVGLVIMVAIFAVLFPHFADYKQALQQLDGQVFLLKRCPMH